MVIEGYNSERCILCGVPLIQKAAVYSYMSAGQNLIACGMHSKNDFWKKAYAIARGDKENGAPAPSKEPQPEEKREEPLIPMEIAPSSGSVIEGFRRKLKEKLDAKSQN